MATFARYIGIDYSGAETPTASLKGLRVYLGTDERPCVEVLPPRSPRKYWPRRGVAEWLIDRLGEDVPTLVGIDHAFSFPLRYFDAHELPADWPTFLEDFQRHWPTGRDNVYVDFVRDGLAGNGAVRSGDSRWRRLAEERAGRAKSVFHFDVQGSVAKSTHAGLPWLRLIRQRLGYRVHFWPFDGWDIPPGQSVLAEVYPSLWSRSFEREDRTQDQHDAYSIATWLAQADRGGTLAALFKPALTAAEQTLARVEGWILGVSDAGARRARPTRESSRRKATPGSTSAGAQPRAPSTAPFTEARRGYYWSIDLRHYLLPSGKPAPLPPRGRRLFEYWTEVVSQATQYDDPTTLRCRRWPARRPCGTLLTISFDIDTNDVISFCPHCHDAGRIAGWEDTFWDNGALGPENAS